MFADLLREHEQWIVTYHEHDSLLENKQEEELNEEERKAAWEDYENEKKGKVYDQCELFEAFIMSVFCVLSYPQWINYFEIIPLLLCYFNWYKPLINCLKV